MILVSWVTVAVSDSGEELKALTLIQHLTSIFMDEESRLCHNIDNYIKMI